MTTFTPSTRVPYRHEDFFFQREQSNSSRLMEWEERIKPAEPYWKALANGIGLVAALIVLWAVI